MITESILKKFRSSIISESIHLPHGTRSAKIVCHTDLDGVVSGISMVSQLVKQGIPRNRITVEFAQYGDEEKQKDKFTDKFEGRKGEYVGVTDFAKFPKAKPFEIFNQLMGFKGDKKEFVDFMKSRDFSKMTSNEFSELFIEKFKPEQNKFTNGSIEKLFRALSAYYKLSKKPLLAVASIANLQYPLVEPQFVSDHHSNEQGALSGGKRGEIEVKSPSEAEFFANKYAPGLWSKEDLEAVSMVDSAGYTEAQLKNTVFLEKHFSGADRKKCLATIISCVYDNLCKKDRTAAAWIIKNASPSLISLYTKTLEAAKYNGARLQYVNLLSQGKVEEAKKYLKEVPDELNKKYNRQGDPTKSIMSLDQWKIKNKKDIENMKTGYKTEADKKKLEEIKGKRNAEAMEIRDKIKAKKGKIVSHNNFSIFNGTDKKTQYTRYATTLYSKDGQRNPFSMRYWDSFFQIAKSTLYKGTVNFAEVNNHVLEDIALFLRKEGISNFNIKRIIDNMKEKNGGHSSGIWSFQGFDMIKPPSKELGDKYYLAKKLADRGNTSDVVKKNFNDKESGIVAKYKDIKGRCMRAAMNSVVKWTNKLYPPSQEDLNNLKTSDETFNEK